MTVRALKFLMVSLTLLVVSSERLAWAHPEGFSGLHVTIEAAKVRAALTLHTRDFGIWFPPGKYPDYVASVCQELAKSVDGIIELQSAGVPVAPDTSKA